MILGKVTGREVAETRDSEGRVLLLQVELTNSRDIQDVEHLNAAGEDASPHDGDFVLVFSLADAFKMSVGVDDGIEPEVDEGEKEAYSYDRHGGSKLARTKWDKTGNVIHNEGARLVARKEDATISNATVDPAFWTFIAAVGAALGITAPTGFTGKVNDGSDTVKVP